MEISIPGLEAVESFISMLFSAAAAAWGVAHPYTQHLTKVGTHKKNWTNNSVICPASVLFLFLLLMDCLP